MDPFIHFKTELKRIAERGIAPLLAAVDAVLRNDIDDDKKSAVAMRFARGIVCSPKCHRHDQQLANGFNHWNAWERDKF